MNVVMKTEAEIEREREYAEFTKRTLEAARKIEAMSDRSSIRVIELEYREWVIIRNAFPSMVGTDRGKSFCGVPVVVGE